MKKILIVLSLIMSMIMFASCGSDAAAKKHDFRNVDFGMTAAELIAAEGEPDQQLSDDMYTYLDREVYGIPHTTLKYEIDESGLWSIRAIFTNEYSDDKQYITEYNTIKDNFTKEWGKPEVISEDESRFSFKCFWNNNPLVLSKTDDGKIMFQFTAWSPAFYEQITSSSAP